MKKLHLHVFIDSVSDVKLKIIMQRHRLLTVVPDNTEKSSASGFCCKFCVLLENNFTRDTYTAIPAIEEKPKGFTH